MCEVVIKVRPSMEKESFSIGNSDSKETFGAGYSEIYSPKNDKRKFGIEIIIVLSSWKEMDASKTALQLFAQ